MQNLRTLVVALLLTSLTVTPAYAGSVLPVSYDMLNGGSDSGLHYWDKKYPDADT